MSYPTSLFSSNLEIKNGNGFGGQILKDSGFLNGISKNLHCKWNNMNQQCWLHSLCFENPCRRKLPHLDAYSISSLKVIYQNLCTTVEAYPFYTHREIHNTLPYYFSLKCMQHYYTGRISKPIPR